MTNHSDEPTFSLYGLRRFAQYGFALPLYTAENFQSNSLYTDRLLISGYMGSTISEFEDVFLEPDHLFDNQSIRQIGDNSICIFLVNNEVFSGPPHEILKNCRKYHKELVKFAPLSYLDLCLYADSGSALEAYSAAYAFLSQRFTPARALSVLAESSLRKYVNISLYRSIAESDLLVDFSSAITEFKINQMRFNYLQISFNKYAFLEIDERSWRRFNQLLGNYLSLIGVEFSIERNLDASAIDAPVSGNGKRRTRRLGLAREIAIDLGTTQTRLFSAGDGLILSEPSVIAIKNERSGTRRVVAVGNDALLMEGRTPQGIEVVRPIRDGVIVDIEVAERMLKYFMKKVRKLPSFFRPVYVVVCVPSGLTGVERRALSDAAVNMGVSEVRFVLQSMAAAVGAGLDVTSPNAFLMLTIGGGVSEAAIVSNQGIAYVAVSREGGDKVTEAIINHLRRNHNLAVGWGTAENLKRQYGVASPRFASEVREILVRGIDTVNSVPIEISISEEELAEIIELVVGGVIELCRTTIENSDPLLSADLMERGIVVAGGGALLRSLRELLEDEFELPVTIAKDPSSAVARGLNISISDPAYARIFHRP